MTELTFLLASTISWRGELACSTHGVHNGAAPSTMGCTSIVPWQTKHMHECMNQHARPLLLQSLHGSSKCMALESLQRRMFNSALEGHQHAAGAPLCMWPWLAVCACKGSRPGVIQDPSHTIHVAGDGSAAARLAKGTVMTIYTSCCQHRHHRHL